MGQNCSFFYFVCYKELQNEDIIGYLGIIGGQALLEVLQYSSQEICVSCTKTAVRISMQMVEIKSVFHSSWISLISTSNISRKVCEKYLRLFFLVEKRSKYKFSIFYIFLNQKQMLRLREIALKIKLHLTSFCTLMNWFFGYKLH